MLFRDRSRPRGCQVRNYSEHGVLLKCTGQESPLKDATMDEGDAVTIRFWDRSGSGRGQEVDGQIARITENEVAVEYSNSESESQEKLLTLLANTGDEAQTEPPQTKPPESPESPDTDHDVPTFTISTREIPKSETMNAPKAGDAAPVKQQPPAVQPKTLVGGLVLGALALLALLVYNFHLGSRIDAVARNASPAVNSTLAIFQAQQSEQAEAIQALVERTAALDQAQQTLSATLETIAGKAELQAAVEDIKLELAELEARYAELATAKAAAEAKVEQPKAVAETPQAAAEALEPQAPVAKEAATAAATGTSKWSVHLVTLSDSGAADKMIAKAKTLGLDVSRRVVSVSDKQMYRLSIKDIASRTDAEELAATAQDQLALKQKPWIARQ